jgi:hypothetical protein
MENTLRKRVWTCRKTGYVVVVVMMMMMMTQRRANVSRHGGVFL